MSEIPEHLKEDSYAELRDKWDLNDVPPTENRRACVTAHVLEMQEKHFRRLKEETGGALGVDRLSDELLPEIREHLQTHILQEICSIQPMSRPIASIHWYKRGGGIDYREIRAESRRVKALTTTGEDKTSFMEELLVELTREVFGCMLNASMIDKVSTDDDLLGAVHATSQKIQQATQRHEANALLGNKDMMERLGLEVPTDFGVAGVLDRKYKVFYDPMFPENRLLAWYVGNSVLDSGIIYSPYVLVEATPTFVDPGDMSLRRALRTRHKITVVRPDYFRVIEVV